DPARTQRSDYFGQHGDGDFRGTCRSDIQADRCANSVNRSGRDTSRSKSLDALGVSLAAAERPYIEAICLQRRLDRKIIYLGIMGDSRKSAIGVEGVPAENDFRPLIVQPHTRETIIRGKGGARIDDMDIETR